MQILNKIWKDNMVYQEPICFSEDINGTQFGGTLLFEPSRIISIVSYDGAISYRENIDYIVVGKRIVRTEKSQIPFLPRSVYCKPYIGASETNWVRLPGGAEYMEVVSDIYRWQVLVTYEHDMCWKGVVPANMAAHLPLFYNLINHGNRSIRAVFFGDSITAGWEASGCNEHASDMVTLDEYHVLIQHPPFQPSWAELVSKSLRIRYPDADFIKINRAAGGSTTSWGVQHVNQLVNPENPDIVFLAFGMNSMWDNAEKYQEEIMQIINQIRSKHSQCEFVLISPMVPNTEIAGFQGHYLQEHQNALFRIANSTQGVIVAPVYSVFCEMVSRGKTYYELTGNCINHPNDFSIRIYAQTILSTLGI